MTPAARYAAAIDLLDQIGSGQPAEKCLTTWARQNRFAGSKDRAAIRDHVFDVLRAKRSLAALGGGTAGRSLILGLLRRDGPNPDTVFGAGGYAPTGLTDDETRPGTDPKTKAEACDIPEWLWPHWQTSLGEAAPDAAQVQQSRGPVSLRVNLRRVSRDEARGILAQDGIDTAIADDVPTGLIVQTNPRRVATSRAYQDGLVELQDLSSQIAMQSLDVPGGARILDYCSGGGGKALALADMFNAEIFAHDIDPARTKDIPLRADRAGVMINVVKTAELSGLAPFDIVLCDAPCSGSGTWRRTPEAKWMLDQDKLSYYNKIQGDVLASGAALVRPSGQLIYATCSVLECENQAAVLGFQAASPGAWSLISATNLQPNTLHDGFFLAKLHNLK